VESGIPAIHKPLLVALIVFEEGRKLSFISLYRWALFLLRGVISKGQVIRVLVGLGLEEFWKFA